MSTKETEPPVGSQAADLTRYNRPGQTRLRYVDGNVSTYLELLRLALDRRFEAKTDAYSVEGMLEEGDLARRARLLAQYQKPRPQTPDWGWEIARSFARACHVLGEHIDAYANEGFLRTALLPESVRRLVALIGYQPAPPASALTTIALRAKAGMSGRIRSGLRLTGAPPSGGPPCVFETLADAYVDEQWNEIRHKDHHRDPTKLCGDILTLAGRVEGLVAGEPLLLVDESEPSPAHSGASSRDPTRPWQACLIASVSQKEGLTEIKLATSLPPYKKGYTTVLLKPKERLSATANSTSCLQPNHPLPGLEKDAIVALYEMDVTGSRSSMAFRKVDSNKEDPPRLWLTTPVQVREVRALLLCPTSKTGGWKLVKTDGLVTTSWAGELADSPPPFFEGEVLGANVEAATELPIPFRVESVRKSDPASKTWSICFSTLEAIDTLDFTKTFTLFRMKTESVRVEPLRTLSLLSPALFVKASRSPASAQKFVVTDGHARVFAVCDVNSKTSTPPPGAAALDPVEAWHGQTESPLWLAQTVAYADFGTAAKVAGWDANPENIGGQQKVEVAVSGTLKGLVGRAVLIENSDTHEVAENEVTKVQDSTLELRDKLPLNLTKSSLCMRANLVQAGHGERRPERILGSGDATRSRQRFQIKEPPPGLSFISDSRMPHGVRPDLQVRVEGLIYRQVARLEDCGPTDAVYTAEISDEGVLVLEFGDGTSGRRLPTGQDNVRVSYRVGSGSSGNLQPNVLKLAQSHPLLSDALQPLPSAGGSDGQDLESLRSHALASLQALDRAVTLGDFAALAASHSSLWQAQATVGTPPDCESPRPNRISVTVHVVPANDATLSDALRTELETFLNNRAATGITAYVRAYKPLWLKLTVTVAVSRETHDPALVIRATQSALRAGFSLRHRRLGQPVYLSEVYKLVESVDGVVSSRCTIALDLRADARGAGTTDPEPDDVSQKLTPQAHQVLCLDPLAPLPVDFEAYQP